MVDFNKAVASRNDDDLLAVYKEFSPDDMTAYYDFKNRRLSIEAYEQFLVAHKKDPELQQVCESIAELHKQVFVDVLVLPNQAF